MLLAGALAGARSRGGYEGQPSEHRAVPVPPSPSEIVPPSLWLTGTPGAAGRLGGATSSRTWHSRLAPPTLSQGCLSLLCTCVLGRPSLPTRRDDGQGLSPGRVAAAIPRRALCSGAGCGEHGAHLRQRPHLGHAYPLAERSGQVWAPHPIALVARQAWGSSLKLFQLLWICCCGPAAAPSLPLCPQPEQGWTGWGEGRSASPG